MYLFVTDFFKGVGVVHCDVIHPNLDTVLLSFVLGYFQLFKCVLYGFPPTCSGGPRVGSFLEGGVEYRSSLTLGSGEVRITRRKSEAIYRVTRSRDDVQPAGRGVSEVQVGNKTAQEERLLDVLLTEVRVGRLRADEHSPSTVTPSTVRT